MLRFLTAILIVLVSAAASAQQSKTVVAIFDFEARGVDFRPDVLERFSLYVSGKLAASNVFQVIPRSQVKMRLLEQKMSSFDECNDESCRVALGKAFSAEKIVSGDILRMGPTCVVNLNLYNLRTETTDAAASADGGCSESEVVGTLAGVVKGMLASTAAISAGDTAGNKGVAVQEEAKNSVLPVIEQAGSSNNDEKVLAGPGNTKGYKNVATVLGRSTSKRLLTKYIEQKQANDDRVVADWGEANTPQYKDFDVWARDQLMVQRKHSRNAMITGAVLMVVGLIPMGVHADHALTAESGSDLISWIAFWGVGGITLISGGIAYAGHNSKIKKFDRLSKTGASDSGPSQKTFAFSPYYDAHNKGGGLQFVVGF